MQTFLPYESFRESAEALDNARLNNQINEAFTIAQSLRMGNGWHHHAASRMWSFNLGALLVYGRVCCEVRQERVGHDEEERVSKFKALGIGIGLIPGKSRVELPAWLGDERLHYSHRANLVRKDMLGNVRPARWYIKRWGGEVNPEDPYFWPSQHEEYGWRPGPIYTP